MGDGCRQQPAAGRIAALDLIRGVAVLGILAINIAGFAGPMAATYTPRAIHPADPAGDAVFAVSLFLFEGKMRALFSILFGAGIALFLERAEAAGRNGPMLQVRRLIWLGLFGYLHYLLLWWGDILLLYACAGLVLLAVHQLPRAALLAAALLAFSLWQADGTLRTLPLALAERDVAAGTASAGAAQALARAEAARSAAMADEMAGYRESFARQVADKAAERPFFPFGIAFASLGETVPLMAIGYVLYGWGFFTRWPRRRLLAIAAGGILAGGAASGAFALWAWDHGFPFRAMVVAINYALSFPRLLMALGYAAALVAAAPAVLRGGAGRRLAAAGRMAFSNYIATTVVMTAIFHGWGLGLIGRIPVSAEPAFVLAGWLLMLAWSAPWLGRFRQGPLEWLWRSLVAMRALPFRRS